ncbi:MAG: hypothetical protein QHH15_00515 [Candidatus Thermoplasmatota archaeon]|nr:hypothetical protein [Candidatus Thermoplasmatota archaeon]MDH7506257.1 hypothetical protein [Candidatus Thermoplasmatota archaeon]
MVVNFPDVDDSIIIVPMGDEIIMIPKGEMPEVGDTVIIYPLSDGTFITNGKNEMPEVGDTVIVYPYGDEFIALTGGDLGTADCPYIGNASLSTGAFTITKRVGLGTEYSQERWISQTAYQTRRNPFFRIWGDLTINIDGVTIFSVTGANGETYNLWDYSFEIPDENGVEVKLIFSGTGTNGMIGEDTGSGHVYACDVEI